MEEMVLDSLQYAKEHKKDFLKQIVDGIKPKEKPRAIFMAGTPGAGKSEVAKSMTGLENFVVIDADFFRSQFPGYNGTNSSDFQSGASLLVDYTFTEVMKKKYPFILDGTFAIGKAMQNVERALKKGYNVTVVYVIQEPTVAWDFTQLREVKEGRRVPKEVFINAYLNAQRNVIEAQKIFGESVMFHVIKKDFKNDTVEYLRNVEDVGSVLGTIHTQQELEELL